jgi:hypothetical protein
MMSIVRTFTVPQPVSGEYNHAFLGTIVYRFPAGTVTPVSEQEEIALEEALVPAGLATRNSDEPREIVAHSFPAEKVAEGQLLEAMTVAELRDVAASTGIDLGAAKRKGDIIAAIVAGTEVTPAQDDPSHSAAAQDDTSGSPDDSSGPQTNEAGDE